MEKKRINRFEEPCKKSIRTHTGKSQDAFMTVTFSLFFAMFTLIAII